MDLTCIVLAGGRGSRLGHDKAKIVVGGKDLLHRVMERAGMLASELVVVTGGPCPCLVDRPGRRVVSDIYPGKGPLGGIHAGLAASRSAYSLVVACDMPFLNQSLLRFMIELAPGNDIVIPRVGELVEPLHAIYSRGCLGPIEQLIRADGLNVRRLLARVKVRYVDREEIERFDPGHLSFFNINTRADLARAREIARRGESEH